AAGLVLGVLPSLFAVDGPHAMRAIGAAAFACTIAALGALALLERVPGRWRSGVGATLLSLALLWNARTYFVDMRYERASWAAFYPLHTRIGAFVRSVAELSSSRQLANVYVPSGYPDHPVFAYLAHGLEVETFDLAGTVSRPAAADSCFVADGYHYREEAAGAARALGAPLVPVFQGPRLPGLDQPSFVVYQPRVTEGS